MSVILPGGEIDRAAGRESWSPGWTVSLRYGVRRQQGEGRVRGSHPLWIQLPGQRLRHLGNHRVIKSSTCRPSKHTHPPSCFLRGFFQYLSW